MPQWHQVLQGLQALRQIRIEVSEHENKPARLEPPRGFLFEITLYMHAGQELKFYVDYFSETFCDYHIPPDVRDKYPDAPVHMEVNPNDISAFTAKPVPGIRVFKEGEYPFPIHTRDGEEVL